MAIELPPEFSVPGPVSPGDTIRSDDWTELIESTHSLWVSHRQIGAGWRWPYEAAGGTDFSNGLADQPDIDDWNPIIRMERPDRGNDFRVGVAAFMRDCELTVTYHPIDVGSGTPIGSSSSLVTLTRDGDWQWVTENAFLPNVSDLFLMQFSIIPEQQFSAPEIRRIILFEQGIDNLIDVDIPREF